MFKKPLRKKSQCQLKSSEKKKVGSKMQIYFPTLTDENLKTIFNNKDELIKSRMLTFNDEIVDIYSVGKIPMFFEVVDKNLMLPTVFCLWLCDDFMPTITSCKAVFNKLKNGADLFLPGVMNESFTCNDLNFVNNQPISLNLVENRCCHAVGTSLMSSCDINMSVQKGRMMKIYHIMGDYLYKEHPNPEVPNLGPPDWTKCFEKNIPDETVLEPSSVSQDEVSEVEEETPAEISELEQLALEKDTETETDRMSSLLEYLFLKTIKENHKTLFPILPSVMFGNYIKNETINLKETKWKKFPVFLEEMSLLGVVNIEKTQKNELKIIGADMSHPKLRHFTYEYGESKQVDVKLGTNGQPQVQQVFLVNAVTLPFFEKFGLKKKDELTKSEIRNDLNDYIKSNKLACVNDKVSLDPLLYGLIKKETVTRGELIISLTNLMGEAHKVTNVDQTNSVLLKGEIPFIEFEIVTKCGNKKVTLINNLEIYNIDVNTFAKDLQHEAAASTTVKSFVPGKKGPQVLVQGNQINTVVKILTEKFKINVKHMKGLDKAKKRK